MSPTYEQRKYSRSRLKKADKQLRHMAEQSEEELAEALDVLINYRALHYKPLVEFRQLIARRVASVKAKDAIIAQRLKRLTTILEKLQRFPEMGIYRMQDIGGIRVILSNMKELCALHELCVGIPKRTPHELVMQRDYIASPKTSGYRGRHLVFRYNSGTEKGEDYDGLQVELQLRTRLQHTWATAVETFEAFLGEKFKSSQGDAAWLDFFAIVSSAFALKEKQPVLPAHADLTPQELYRLVRDKTEQLQVLDMIGSFRVAVESASKERSGGFVLLVLDTVEKVSSTRTFPPKGFNEAYQAYEREELRSRKEPTRQVVLARANDLKKLAKAYPNYFADLSTFRKELEAILAKAVD